MNPASSSWQLAINSQCANSRRSRHIFLPETRTHTRVHTHTHACTFALRFSHRDEVDEVGRRANPLSNSNPSHRRFPSLSTVVVRVTRQARNVVIAEIMVVPTVRRDEQNGGDYVTLKFNSAIVPRTRERDRIRGNFDTVS